MWQYEQGEQGTPHIQGYVLFKNPRSFNSIKKQEPLAHIEKAHADHSKNTHYCSKPIAGCACQHCVGAVRLDGPWTIGEEPKQGERTDLSEAIKVFEEGGISKLVAECPEVFVKYHTGFKALAQEGLRKRKREGDVEVVLYIGKTGKGKTRAVMDSIPWEELYKHEPGSQWFDGYEGQDVILLDEFCGAASNFRLDYLLSFLDRYPLRLSVKNSHTYLLCSKIFVATNIHPRSWYKWDGRVEQYSALRRRFSKVVVFGDTGQSELTGDDLDRFWGSEDFGPAYDYQVDGWKYSRV